MDTNKKNTLPHPNNLTLTFQKKSPSLSPPKNLTAVFSIVNRTIKTEIKKIYDFLWLWSKKVHFLWLFIAIKFKLSLVITFMAFYDYVRTLIDCRVGVKYS